MKILVDEMPSSPLTCDMRKFIPTLESKNGCYIARSDSFECKQGEEGFECPYFQAFKACAIPPVPRGMDGIVKTYPYPVKLGDPDDF